MRKIRVANWTLAVTASLTLTCSDEDRTSSSEHAVAGESGDTNGDGSISPDEVITDPVPPEGYTGDPWATLPITPEDEAAIAEAMALSAARNPPGQSAVDRGFAAAPGVTSTTPSSESVP